MLKRYLIVGILFLIGHQGMSQSGEIYASTAKQRPPDSATETYSLKEGLSQLEKQFEVSIAYKDEWVTSKIVQVQDASFYSGEEACVALLLTTNPYY